jgi:hypothetical protein
MDHIESVFVGQPFAARKGALRSKNAVSPARSATYPRVTGVIAWLSWCTTLGVSERARSVLLVLADLHTRYREVYPSVRWLAVLLGCSASSVRAALRELTEAGVVQCVSRYEQRPFSGGRQTSNRYEFLRGPEHEALGAFTIVDGSELPPGVEVACDDVDPSQLELDERLPSSATEQGRAITSPPPIGSAPPRAPTRAPQPPSAPAARLAAEPVTPSPPPFKTAPPPLQSVEGMYGREENLKANSTGARTAEPVSAPRQGTPKPAAAFLGEVLPTERATALKRRFGLSAYGSLMFVVRRNECQAHPALVSRLLERLAESPEVRNPGAWFYRVFAAEREAAELVGPPTAEDQVLEAERLEAAQLLARQKALEAQLVRVRGCDLEAEDRARAELEAVLRARRRAATREGVDTPCAPSGPPVSRVSGSASPEPLPAEEQAAEAARILAMLRGRAA